MIRTAHHLRHKRRSCKKAHFLKKILLALFDSLWLSVILVSGSGNVALYLSLFFPPFYVSERNASRLDRWNN